MRAIGWGKRGEVEVDGEGVGTRRTRWTNEGTVGRLGGRSVTRREEVVLVVAVQGERVGGRRGVPILAQSRRYYALVAA